MNTNDSRAIALRVEWSKAHARAARYGEEKTLVVEEMRRVLAYHQWKASWWRDRSENRTDAADPIHQGARAYALKQSHLWRSWATKFLQLWHPILVENSLLGDIQSDLALS